MEYYDEYPEEEDHLAEMPWGEAFYDAVDSLIYQAVGQAISSVEDRLSHQINDALSHLE